MTASLGTYALPRGLIQITSEKKSSTIEIKVKALIIPDGSVKYQLNHDASWFADDVVQVTTNNDGLLKTVWSNVEDRTDEVLVDVARAIGAVQGFTVSPGAGRAFAPGSDYSVIIDPRRLNEKPDWITVTDLSGGTKGGSKSNATQPVNCSPGLCSRPLKPWLVRITLEEGRYHDQVVYLPDEEATFVVRMDRAFMGSKQYYISFDRGIINQVYLHEPSSAEALAELPYNVIKALLSVPTEMIKLRYDYSSHSKDLAAAETLRIQEEAKYRNYLLGLSKSSQEPSIAPQAPQAPAVVIPPSPQAQPQLPPYGPKPPTLTPPPMEPQPADDAKPGGDDR